jgi:GTP-binding protein
MPTSEKQALPVVALVGVPNAGKSTLFNRLLGERRALVADIPGTTRDRIQTRWRAAGKPCLLCDTGGYAGRGVEELALEIERQTFAAIEEATVIVLVLDGRTGLTAGDRELASRLRPVSDRIVVAWNKADEPRRAAQATEAFELGFGEPVAVSAEHGLGTADLVEAIAGKLPGEAVEGPPDPGEEIRIAIVGRPNVGKSSLLNRLCGASRVTVAAEPGTTRDTVDTEVERDGRLYRFVDTAGIRRPSRLSGPLERLGVMMARRAIQRADVALVLFDASEGIVAGDLSVMGIVEESGRGAVLVANKWDLVEDKEERIKLLKREAEARMRFARHAPFVTISAKSGQRAEGLYPLIDEVNRAADITISTPRLNRFLTSWRAGGENRASGPRFLYLTQVGTRPPRFVAFGTGAEKVHFSEARHLENRLREEFGIGPTPIRITFRSERKERPRHPHRDRSNRPT